MKVRVLPAGALVAVAASLTVAACGSSSSTSATQTSTRSSAGEKNVANVTIAIPAPIAAYAMPYYAQAKGLFKAEGINVDIKVLSSSEAVPALAGDKLQFYVGGAPGPDISAINAPIRILATYGSKPDAQLIAQSSVSSTTALKGQSIGISAPGALSDYLALITLGKAGLSSKTVTLRPLGQLATSVAAFKSKQIDAVVVSPPTTDQLLKAVPGAHILNNYATQTPWTFGGIYANGTWATAHRQETIDVLKAMKAAVADWPKDPSGAEAVLKKDIQDPAPKADYRETLGVLQKSLTPEPRSVEQFVLNTLKHNGYPQLDPADWQKYDDSSYIDAAK